MTMQTLSFQQNTGFNPGALINRNQAKVADHDGIRSAVRAWAAAEGQDVVSAYIIDEWRQQGGKKLNFPRTSAAPARSFSVTWITRSILKSIARMCVF